METRWSLSNSPVPETPAVYFLRHHIFPCGLSVLQCPLLCTFSLPTTLCFANEFKQHFFADHASFCSQRAVATGVTDSFMPGWVFDKTDLSLERLETLQKSVRQLCGATQPDHNLHDNYGFLEVLHVPHRAVHFVCSKCTYTCTVLYDIKRHLLFEHILIVRQVPYDLMDELTSVRGLGSVRLTSPRIFATPTPIWSLGTTEAILNSDQ